MKTETVFQTYSKEHGNMGIIDTGKCYPYKGAPRREKFYRAIALDEEGLIYNVSTFETLAEAKNHLKNLCFEEV